MVHGIPQRVGSIEGVNYAYESRSRGDAVILNEGQKTVSRAQCFSDSAGMVSCCPEDKRLCLALQGSRNRKRNTLYPL
jgi:hypothetical protein